MWNDLKFSLDLGALCELRRSEIGTSDNWLSLTNCVAKIFGSFYTRFIYLYDTWQQTCCMNSMSCRLDASSIPNPTSYQSYVELVPNFINLYFPWCIITNDVSSNSLGAPKFLATSLPSNKIYTKYNTTSKWPPMEF